MEKQNKNKKENKKSYVAPRGPIAVSLTPALVAIVFSGLTLSDLDPETQKVFVQDPGLVSKMCETCTFRKQVEALAALG